MDEQQMKKHKQMTETPVGPLILKLAAPCMVSVMVTAFYNMADTLFVGMLKSNAATGAVGVVFSLMAIIQAIGFCFGQGSGNFISRAIGHKDYEEASTMASTGFFVAFACGAVICVGGLLFLEPLAYLLGSTDTILPYTKAYLSVILLGAPWMTASLVLNNELRFQGNAAYAMVGITSGAILNTKGGTIRLSIHRVRPNAYYLLWILKGGLPSLARQGLSSVATICLNQACRTYGDAAIAAMGVVQRIMHFGASTMIGFGQGFQPVCGFNYGAGLYRRVKQGFWFCVKTSFGALLALSILGFVFAPQLVALFRDDPDVIACGAAALRYQCITFSLQSWMMSSNMTLQTMGLTAPATFLSVTRQGLFFIPLVWGLALTVGLPGIQMAQMVADLLTFACTVPIQLWVLNRLNLLEEGKIEHF